ncbi:MAG: hypothetical protein HZA66_03405 [Rhodopseudomonas palustris]|uniref:Uncharacterized protein n=1 Tax=Rhodopseudomonas palustris TaxID=1076 RepID=A0A933VZH8_RHOPL|nr:hypothetical protein [Rhodopseudomonas palustris]
MAIASVRAMAAALILAVSGSACNAQTTTPRLTMQGPAERSIAPVPRDALGRACLDVEAAARRQSINSDMLDHVVSFKNSCPRQIKVKVCYLNSTRCNDLDIQAYKRVDTILGQMKGVGFFRYTVTQR